MRTKDEEAKFIAEAHYALENSLSVIYWMIGPQDAEQRLAEPIKLLEGNSDTFPSGVLPLGFGPSPASGLHYPSIIVEVTPDEFRKIRSDDLKLPHGWTIGPLIPRPPADPRR